MSEWGNPAWAGNRPMSLVAECIGHRERTQGTETSKYLQERKSTETPLVAASESGYSPNRSSDRGCGRYSGVTKAMPAEESGKSHDTG